MNHVQGFLFRVFFVFGGAVKYAGAAAGAVFHRYLYGEFLAGNIAFAVGRFEGFGRIFQRVGIIGFNADSRVRAHQGAETALDAGVRVPFGYHNGNIAFFILRGSGRIYAAFRHSGGG